MAAEKRGFGVHALEVWQKSSHVKRTEECHKRRGRRQRGKRQQGGESKTSKSMLSVLKGFLKCSLRKRIWREFFGLGPGERSAFFVVTGIKVYIIIIMGQLKY